MRKPEPHSASSTVRMPAAGRFKDGRGRGLNGLKRALTSIEQGDPRKAARTLDVLSLLIGSLICFQLAWRGGLPVVPRERGTSALSDLIFTGAYSCLVLCFIRKRALSYGVVPSTLAACADVLRACTLAVLLASGIHALFGAGNTALAAAELWTITVTSMCTTRIVIARFARFARRRGYLLTPTLIVGAGRVGARVVRRLRASSQAGLEPVGFLDADPHPETLNLDGMVPVLGAPDDLAEVCTQTGARHVILAFTSERDHRLVELVTTARQLGIEVLVVPRLYESINDRATVDRVGGMPLLTLGGLDSKGWQFSAERLIDRIRSMVAERPRFGDGVASATPLNAASGQSQDSSSGVLELVIEPEEAVDSSPSWFCGYCGASVGVRATPAPIARVCEECGEGLMLEVRSDAAPKSGDPFLVVDTKLTVQAVSRQAEQVLDVQEEQVTDRPISELLVGADAEQGEEQSLADLLARAAMDGDSSSTVVRPRNTFGVRLRARIAGCGPPRASLVVFEAEQSDQPRRGHLRLVPDEVKTAEVGR